MRGENYIPACLRDLPKQKSRSAETKRKKHDRDLADLTITECIQRIKAARRSKPKDWERGYNSAISVLELFALEVKEKQWAGTEGAAVNQKITTEEPQPAAQGEFGDAYQGAREDLAIWKRRALEAEEKLRAQCDDQSFMGEPLVQPYEAPREKIEALFKQLGFNGQVSVGEILDAALTALKAQQVGQEPVLWARQCDLDESDPALFVSRERVEESGYTVPFYPHPTNSVEGEPVGYTTTGMLAIAKELPLTGRIGARCKADERWNVPLYTAPQPAPAQDVAGSIMLSQEGAKILAEAIGAHAYVLGALVNGRPDLAMNEAKKWVDGFMDAGSSVTAHDKQSGEVKP